MGIISKLLGRQKPPADKKQSDGIVSIPPGLSGPMIGLVRGIMMKPLPVSPERLERLKKNADDALRKSLEAFKPGSEITPSEIASSLLGSAGDAAVSHVIRLLGHNDRDVGRIAGDMCVSLGMQAVPELSRVLKAPGIDSRQDAAAAILRIAAAGNRSMPREITVGLAQLIRQENLRYWDVIAIAAAALGEIGKDAMPDIIALLHDESYLVRLAGVAALTRMGDGTALSALQQARRDETSFTVAEAIDYAIGMTKETAAKTGGISE
jgi:HEAT repeat protein